jgi:Transglycosylase-like domain
MDRLHFGARSRRKARRRHLVIAAWLAGLIAMLCGVPGSDAALGWFGTAAHSDTLAASDLGFRHPAPGTVRLGTRSEAHAPKPKPVARPKPKVKPGSRPVKPAPTPTPTLAPSPSPSPTPVPVTAAPGSTTAVIYAAAAASGISGTYLLSIARCESDLNTGAHSSAGYYGLFQFDRGTWSEYGYGSIYDPQAQARTAARLIAAGQTGRWPNCA